MRNRSNAGRCDGGRRGEKIRAQEAQDRRRDRVRRISTNQHSPDEQGIKSCSEERQLRSGHQTRPEAIRSDDAV